MISILIDIAIDEKETDEVIRWYDYPAEKGRYPSRWSEHMEDRIAEAIEKRYPDRATAIWKGLVEAQIALTKPSAYEAAPVYLKKLQGLLVRQGRGMHKVPCKPSADPCAKTEISSNACQA